MARTSQNQGSIQGPIRKRIGIVFQSFNLFPHMTAQDNVTLAPWRVHGRSKAELRDEITHLFERFGLADYQGAIQISSQAASNSASQSSGRLRCSPKSCSSMR